jgi:hypothetical protein
MGEEIQCVGLQIAVWENNDPEPTTRTLAIQGDNYGSEESEVDELREELGYLLDEGVIGKFEVTELWG